MTVLEKGRTVKRAPAVVISRLARTNEYGYQDRFPGKDQELRVPRAAGRRTHRAVRGQRRPRNQ
ncbi:hypothetical protein CBM2592_P120050 [Cupriavidus taiwanensis]|uniref:Uncharacterized protein n=1 Tax=Cupriavidus taiwanensis TaxID=164546 RepID=A0A375CSJ2_9BURK|nr:hypothetical protein CBM2588_P100054 [Cupriavidus taiwanensis]SOY74167.1 hypothetical protein CBM2592_P120050 [Cupriavidus taiwanensis]SOY78273.1 hypothetical protein CBM2586_P90024 [Cupriavidus taiwanensis]SOZ02630.1 hypothetical protein CBM2600_P90024 [Cupriavidus taiwanensis]SOZ21298.1 hypothetical protein CBM2595_P90052 [Cupriavidus taiwanensis]